MDVLKAGLGNVQTEIARLSEGFDKLNTNVNEVKTGQKKLYDQFARQHKKYTLYMWHLERRWQKIQEAFIQQGMNIMAEVRNALADALAE
jgi:hypothetical protein